MLDWILVCTIPLLHDIEINTEIQKAQKATKPTQQNTQTFLVPMVAVENVVFRFLRKNSFFSTHGRQIFV